MKSEELLKPGLALLLYILSIVQLFGRDIRVEGYVKDPKVNSYISVADNHYAETISDPDWQGKWEYRTARPWVKLTVEPRYSGVKLFDHTTTVEVMIRKYEAGSLEFIEETRTLEVEYSPEKGDHPNGDQLVGEVRINLVDQAVRLYVKVISVNVQIPLLGASQEVNVTLSAGIDINKYYHFAPNVIPAGSVNSAPLFDPNNPDEIEVTWNRIPGAEFYDLEWTFVDLADRNASNAELSDLDFKHNSTRVRLSSQHNLYKIPVIYPHGAIVYRIRGVGLSLKQPLVGYYGSGRWSSDGGGSKTYVDDWNHVVIIPDGNGFEEKLNKQVELAFIEDGRRKEIVTFFDGTGRNRQQLTRSENISETITVIGETVYDFAGREAVTFLPAPAYESGGYKNSIAFAHAFNLNSETTPVPFDAGDFDKDFAVESCVDLIQQASSTSGAAEYYGPDYVAQADNSLWSSYVPLSHGYPFSQMEYTRDQTGRVRSSGGVGPEFQIGATTHYTRNYYGAPDQYELDKLFGTEVGHKKFYRKNMTIDPNGQASYTYLDPQGRTIATSLAGNAPPNLDALSSVATFGSGVTDLLGNLESGGPIPDLDEPDDSNILIGNSGYTYSGNYLSPVANNPFTLKYEMESESYDDPCVSDLYDYKYILDIKVLDECGTDLVDMAMPQSVPSSGYTWSSDDLTSSSPTLDIGEYGIYKNISIDEDAMFSYLEDYLEDVIADGSCLVSLEDFELDETGLTDIDIECDFDCVVCANEVNAAYTAGELTDEERDFMLEECGFPCQGGEMPSMCTIFNMSLEADVGLYGQYGSPNGNDPLSFFFERYENESNLLPSIWYDPSIEYKDELDQPFWVQVNVVEGEYQTDVFETEDENPYMWMEEDGLLFTRPNNLLSVVQFTNIWEPSWAEALVEYHPEYCLKTFCEKVDGLQDNVDFINGLTNGGFQLMGGVLDPGATVTDISGFSTLSAFRDIDPFIVDNGTQFKDEEYFGFIDENEVFNGLTYGDGSDWDLFNSSFDGDAETLSAEFDRRLNQYIIEMDWGPDLADPTDDQVIATYSIEVAAANLSNCGGNFDADCFDPNAVIDTDDERALLQSLYLGIRTIMLLKASLYYSVEHGCYNECIGNPFDISRYPEIQTVVNIENENFGSSVCDGENALFFAGKDRRYGFDANTLDNISINGGIIGSGSGGVGGYGGSGDIFSVTGLCINEFELLNFLNSLLQEELFASSTGSVIDDIALEDPTDGFYSFTPLMYELVNPNGTVGDMILDGEIIGSTLHYDFDFTGQPAINPCHLDFTIPVLNSAVLDWSDYNPNSGTFNPSSEWRITEFSQYMFDIDGTDFTFYLVCPIEGNTGVYDEVVLEVNTCIDLRSNCSPENCEPSDLALQLKALFNVILADDYSLSSTIAINLQTEGYFDIIGLDLICNSLGVESSQCGYQYNSTDSRIEIGGANGTNSSYYYLTSANPSYDIDQWVSSINHVNNVVPTNSNPAGQMAITATTGSTAPFGNLFFAINIQKVTLSGGNVVDSFTPSLFSCDEFLDCEPETGTFNPHDIATLLSYYIYSGNSIAIDGQSIVQVAEVLEAAADYPGLNEDWWFSNLMLDQLDPDWESAIVGGNVDFDLIEVHFTSVSVTANLNNYSISIEYNHPSHPHTFCTFEANVLPEYSVDEEYTACFVTCPPPEYEIYCDLNENDSCFVLTQYFPNSLPSLSGFGQYTYEICSSCIDFDWCAEECEDCIEPPVPAGNDPPLSCNEAYDIYTDAVLGMPAFVNDFIEDLSTDIYGTMTVGTADNDVISFASQAEFCQHGLSPMVQEYLDYLDEVTSILTSVSSSATLNEDCSPEDDPFDIGCWFYVSIQEFTSGNYYLSLNEGTGTNPMLTYYDYLNAIAGLDFELFTALFMTLGEFHAGGYSYYCLDGYIDSFSDANPLYEEFSLDEYCTGPDQLLSPVSFCPFYNTPTNNLIDIYTSAGSYFEDTPSEVLSEYCDDYTAMINSQNSWVIYQTQLENLSEDFIENYTAGALSTLKEKFTKSSGAAEHHFMLYYYDRNGNLIKTVPPLGVKEGPQNPGFDIANVETERNSGVYTADSRIEYDYSTNYKYNSLNQLTYQNTPDGGETFFYYDKLGRLVASQNARQAIEDQWSYTSYDKLGRIVESGQLTATSPPSEVALNDDDFPNSSSWPSITTDSKEEIIATYYDEPTTDSDVLDRMAGNQRYSRNRVSYFENISHYNTAGFPVVDHAMYYDYDIHGNVKTLINQFPDLYQLDQNDVSDQSLKKVEYEYDLISGSVKDVDYQAGFADQFYHRYFYDSQNRLTRVKTSNDGILWQEDARYYYYAHGPLARVELGQNDIQGTDYMYTLQGWLKGVNSDDLYADSDPGQDGAEESDRDIIASEDAFSFSLNYYDGNLENQGFEDYEPRNSLLGTTNNPPIPIASYSTGTTNPDYRNLYNGNISRMSTGIYDPIGGSQIIPKVPSMMVYQYDQLNRITGMENLDGYDRNTNSWTAVPTDLYKTAYTYDANGNLETLERNGNDLLDLEMDDFEYVYHENTNGLKRVDENVSSSPYAGDIEPLQPPLNTTYVYDEIGNLIEDKHEEIEIYWKNDGKIKSMERMSGVADLSDLEFKYDPMGNRISKLEKTRTGIQLDDPEDWRKTYYVRDAQGNTMATYTRASDELVGGLGGYSHKDDLTVNEHHLYGSKRLGIRNTGLDLVTRTYGLDAQSQDGRDYSPNIQITEPNPFESSFVIGLDYYELANHLGNVLSVITDNTWANFDQNTVIGFLPDIVSATDYYPFGSPMPGRSYDSDAFRYGFQGQEKDDEIKGAGNSLDFGSRMHDPRLGRWLSVDPLQGKFPGESPYSFAGDNPIYFLDEDGNEKVTFIIHVKNGQKKVVEMLVNEDYVMEKPKLLWYPNFPNEGARAVEYNVDYNVVEYVTINEDNNTVSTTGDIATDRAFDPIGDMAEIFTPTKANSQPAGNPLVADIDVPNNMSKYLPNADQEVGEEIDIGDLLGGRGGASLSGKIGQIIDVVKTGLDFGFAAGDAVNAVTNTFNCKACQNENFIRNVDGNPTFDKSPFPATDTASTHNDAKQEP